MFGKLRKFARRSARPVVMLIVAGALALSLTVSTTQKAEANPLTVATLPALTGAMKLVMPNLLLAAIRLHPVGFAITTIGALALGAYSSRDYWMPYVTGTFGQPDGIQPKSPEQLHTGFQSRGPIMDLDLRNKYDDAVYPGPEAVEWRWTFLNPEQTQHRFVGYSAALSCFGDDPATPIGTKVLHFQKFAGYYSFPVADAVAGVEGTREIECAAGGEVKGIMIGPLGAHPLLTQSTAQVDGWVDSIATWGDLLEGGFDPRGPGTTYNSFVECIDVNGVKTELVGPPTAGDVGSIPFLSCEAAGKGHGTGKQRIEGLAPGSTVPEVIWEVEAPAQDPNQPLCGPNRPDSGCKMAISVDGKECVVGVLECENWTEVARDDLTGTRVECHYGPYPVALDQCGLMEPAYRPGGAPSTEENTDGNPNTRSNTEPGGQQYTQPSTGTSTGTVPGVGGQPGSDASENEEECFPSGWAMFNPVEWVMRPVGCALKVAFVPNPVTVQTQSIAIQTKFEDVGFSRITTAWFDTFQAAGGGSGCTGPTVNFEMSGVQQSLQPFNACSAPMSTVAAVSYAVSAIGMVLFGGLGIARAIAAGFGFNFSMGKGGDTT